MCNDTGGTLAIVGDEDENRVVTELVSPDGSWIGLRAEGGALKWVNGTDVVLRGNEFAVDDDIDIDDDDMCVAADRRGILENWVIDPCFTLHPFVCEFTDKATCLSSVGRNSSDSLQPLSTPCPDLAGVYERICDGITDAIDTADPLCKQNGSEYNEMDRTCCGGKADGEKEDGGGSSLNIAAIVGGAGGAAFLLIVILVIVLARRHRRPPDTPILRRTSTTTTTVDNDKGAKLDDGGAQIPTGTEIVKTFGDQKGISTRRDFGVPSTENGSQQGPGDRHVDGIETHGEVVAGTDKGRVSNDTKTTDFYV